MPARTSPPWASVVVLLVLSQRTEEVGDVLIASAPHGRGFYAPEHTSVVVVDGGLVGSVTLRPVDGGLWLEHFCLSPALQGRGVGTAVLRSLLARADEEGATVRLDVLQGSAARALYERHGSIEERQDPVDVFMVRTPVS